MKKYLIGIDEAGRGPLAGPVAVGVACVPIDFDWQYLQGVNDSKQLSAQKREVVYARAQQLQKQQLLQLQVSMVSAAVIDRIGIVPSVKQAMERSLARLRVAPHECVVRLDGGLYAPTQYVDQETIIKGDSREQVIGLASILAKVMRDRHMVRKAAAPLFAPYDLAAHKGYGTKAHRQAIRQFGLSKMHRRSFCKNLIV